MLSRNCSSGWVGASWLHEVDWDFWRDSAQTLPLNHPMIARASSQPALPPPPGDATPVDGAEAGRNVTAIDRLVTMIRQWNYLIRTEEAYRP